MSNPIMYPKIFFVVCLGGFVTVFGFGVVQPFLPLYARDLGASETVVGLAISSYFITRLFIELPSGIISDRVGRRIPLLTGMALSFLGAVLCSLAYGPPLLILGRAVWGMGTALFFSSSTAFIFDLFEARVRSQAMGAFQSIEFIGSVIGAPLGGLIATYIGMRTPFTMVAALAIIGFMLLLTSKEFKENTKRAVNSSNSSNALTLSSIVELLRIGGLIVIGIGTFARSFVMQGTIATIFPLYIKSLGMDISITGAIMGVRSLGMIAGTYTANKLINRFGVGKVLLAGFLSESVTIVLFTVEGGFEQFVIAFFNGIISGVEMNSLMIGVSLVVPPPMRGTGVGVYRTFMDVGSIVGPIALTALLAAVGYPSIRLCFYASAAVMVVAASMMLFLRNMEIREQSEKPNPERKKSQRG